MRSTKDTSLMTLSASVEFKAVSVQSYMSSYVLYSSRVDQLIHLFELTQQELVKVSSSPLTQ